MLRFLLAGTLLCPGGGSGALVLLSLHRVLQSGVIHIKIQVSGFFESQVTRRPDLIKPWPQLARAEQQPSCRADLDITGPTQFQPLSMLSSPSLLSSWVCNSSGSPRKSEDGGGAVSSLGLKGSAGL